MGDTATEVQVITPTSEDWRGVADTLAAAFIDDPVFCWLVPNARRRPAALAKYFAVEARDIALDLGVSVAACTDAGIAGAALIFPPDRWQMPARSILAHLPSYLDLLRWRVPHALGLLTAVERRHLRAPHYYFGYIGVAPRAQGRGVGTTMLAPALQRCDDEQLPAYLEASSENNARLYARLGFELVDTIAPFGAPPIRLMVRAPR